MRRLLFISLVSFELSGCGNQSSHLNASGSEPSAIRPAHCIASDIMKIERPFKSREGHSTFSLFFSYTEPAATDGPVVIVIPGGPGGTSIDQRARLPSGFGAVHTDPRGVGCNEGLYPEDFYSSENLASDVVAIIRHLNLKNYIIFGSSYGTSLTTIIAAEIAKTELAQPSSLVLEGILGRAWTSSDELYSGFVEQWEHIKAKLPAAAVSRLTSEDSPAGISNEVWSDAIQTQLRYGSVNQNKSSLSTVLPLLASNTPAFDKLIRDVFDPSGDASTGSAPALLDGDNIETPSQRMYRVIACREFLPSRFGELRYEKGKFVTRFSDDTAKYCDGISLNRFDAKSYKIRVPIYYLEGEMDPATPVFQARYHFDSQPQARRFYIQIPEAGHGPLNLSLGDCSDSIWQSIANRGEGIKLAVSKCAAQPSIEEKSEF